MKDRPILFSAPMVNAILDGSKTQTRRIVKPQFPQDAEPAEMCAVTPEGYQTIGHSGIWWNDVDGNSEKSIKCPYGAVGDKLWVRETWGYRCSETIGKGDHYVWGHHIEYTADGARRVIESPESELTGMPRQRRPHDGEERLAYEAYLSSYWRANRPSIHMPRWASRITLEITDVRVERLKDISEDDAKLEGTERDGEGWKNYDPIGVCWLPNARHSFMSLWEKINGIDSWALNPWVWAIEFKRVKP